MRRREVEGESDNGRAKDEKDGKKETNKVEEGNWERRQRCVRVLMRGRGEGWRVGGGQDVERDISLPAHAKIISPRSAWEAACIAD